MAAPVPSPDRSAADRRYRMLVALGLLVAAGAMLAAILRTDTDEDTPPTSSGRRDVVEHLLPPDGSEILRQAELGADLAPGFEGVLVVNEVEIPADQLRLVPEQNQVFFTPGEGKVIEELAAGRNCIVVVAWRSSVGRGPDDERTRWCVDAT